ncbi:MAG: CotH kinase family protein [Planctomycetes bacterium]|nr:CotH kinase family protein [Planctomycetota bacterium]
MRRAVHRVARALWRFGWIVALPFAVVSIWAFTTALDHFRRFGIERITTPYVVSLSGALRETAERAARRLRLAVTPPAPTPLRRLRLTVGSEILARLDADPPYSGRIAVPAMLTIDDDTPRTIELRRRGDTYGHWGRAKRSFRVRTAQDQRVGGMRTFHLIAPELDAQLENALGYRLARRLGLLAPHSEFVRLEVDGEDHGVFELTELFANAGTWDVGADDGAARADAIAPLRELVDLVSRPLDAARAERLAGMLDLPAFARFSLVEQLTQSNHVDHFHNWKLHWDPWRRRFEPIVWDVNGWERSMCPPEGEPLDLHPTFSPLHARLHSLAPFLAERDAAIAAFFLAGGEDALLADLDALRAATDAAFAADPLRTPCRDDDWSRATAEFVARVHRTAGTLALSWSERSDALLWQPAQAADDPLLLRVVSVRPVRTLRLDLRAGVRPDAIVLVVPREGGDEVVDLTGRWRHEDDTLVIDVALASEHTTALEFRPPELLRNHRRLILPTNYELRLRGMDARAVRTITGSDGRDFEEYPKLPRVPVRDLFLVSPAPALAPRSLSGSIAIDGPTKFAESVAIAPGTTFTIAPNATLEFRGRVEALGTRDAPIRFVRAAADAPFRAVLLAGRACDGSRLQGCSFEGGSIWVHDVRGVVLSDCASLGASGSDDALHFVHAAAHVERLRVEDAAGDGVDADASEVRIDDATFVRCGNDGIDLMQSRAVLRGVRCEDCGDKGMSIGEASLVMAIDVFVERCAVGVEVRDGSRAALRNAELRACAVPLRAAEKDLRYGDGGRIEAHRSILHPKAGSAPVVDGTRSEIALSDCLVPAPSGAWPRVELADCDDGAVARRPLPPLPDALRVLGEVAAAQWAEAAGERRGARGPR